MNKNFSNFLPNNKVNSMYAICIDTKHIWYKCPFTKSNLIHQHGNDGNLLNRKESRSAHQQDSPECCCGNVEILIGNHTERISMKHRNTSFIKVRRSKKRMNAIYQEQKEKAFWIQTQK